MKHLRIKSLAIVKKELNKTEMKKTLGAFDLIMLGLGGIIGTGIFVITGLAAAEYAGPAITLSFALGGLACVFTALAYSELASMLPVAGSAYTYAYVTMGEAAAVFVGWSIIMLTIFGAATVAAGWSGYVVGMLESTGIHLPIALTHVPSQGGMINLPAVLIVLLLSLFLVRGTQSAAKLNGILVVVKLIAILLFVTSAYPHIDPKNWEVFAPNGFFGIAAGAGFVFMAYTGFDTLAAAAEECHNPNRDLPLAIIASLVISAVLYVVVSGILTAIVPYASLNNSEPMAFALRQNGIGLGAKLVATGVIAGMTTVLLSQIYAVSRVLLVMGRDGIFPKVFTRIHPILPPTAAFSLEERP
jgi:APA family basic amino acid/polyamine antiporter